MLIVLNVFVILSWWYGIFWKDIGKIKFMYFLFIFLEYLKKRYFLCLDKEFMNSFEVIKLGRYLIIKCE